MRPARLSRHVLVSLTCISLIALGPTVAPVAASPLFDSLPDSALLMTPVLAQGRMLDVAGRPLAGVARLYAWPQWSPSDPPGATTELPLVAWAVAGPGGAFALRTPLGWNHGTDNFVLFATSGDLRFEHHLVPAALTEPLEIRFDPRSQSVDRSEGGVVRPAGFIDRCHRKELDRHERQQTSVGEVGTTRGVNATFAYVTRADSTVSVAVRAGDRWGVRGERHISNEQTAKYIQGVRSPEQHSIESFFTYVRWEVTCNAEDFNPSEELSAEYWDGGGKLVAKHVPSCAGVSALAQEAGSTFVRDQNRAQTWSGAAHVLGAEFSASSGYSKHVSTTWTFGYDQSSYAICGENGERPTQSKRVFVGLEAPPRACPPRGPCVR